MLPKLQQAVLRRIESNWQSEIEFLGDLVAERSTLGFEAGAQERIARELRGFGLEPDLCQIDLADISRHRGFSKPEWKYDARPNLTATVGGAGNGGRSLTFNGHVDVVPATPEHHWRHDPWSATIENGRMYGRGAADMKSGIAAMIYAVRAMGEAGVTLQGDLVIDTVIEEECTGNGTLAALTRRSAGDGAIIPEPFNQTLMAAQVGVLWCRIVVRGKGAHVLGAERAVNAVQKAQILIDAIRDLEREANGRPRPEEFRELEHPLNYNIGVVQAGDWPSSVPSECTLEVSLSAFPGEDLDAVAEGFRKKLLEAAGRDEWLVTNPPDIDFFAFRAEGCTLDAESPLFTTLDRAHDLVVGGKPKRYISTATTDVRFFSLYHDTPATCYGPIGGNLHAPDEWVDLQSVKETTAVLALAAMEWCGVAGVDRPLP